MEIKIKSKIKVEVKWLLIEANVRYWEDTTVNGIEDENGDLIPCREGDTWKPIIDIETGIITNWEKGKKADIHYKVCDAGEYWLLDEKGEKVVKSKGYYVPGFLAIDDDGMGDYIIMKVNKEGLINNWRFYHSGFKKKRSN